MNLLDLYYSPVGSNELESNDFSVAKRCAFAVVLPEIMDNELTEIQAKCLKMKYIKKMTQTEIAEALGISQPTVSRHISAAAKTVNTVLRYCYIALTKALFEYDKSYM